ncbi:aminotransferase class IV [Nonomuraea dietziae]|uniref:aminotransferase class IV n=1 Tax=Nonomuraea dietziae TaxID=65515 RepID=UPI0031D41D4A
MSRGSHPDRTGRVRPRGPADTDDGRTRTRSACREARRRGGKTYFLRQAVAQGFDDAAFVDRQGRLSEATIWNLAFWDGAAVVWPEARDARRDHDGHRPAGNWIAWASPQRVQEVTPADCRRWPELGGHELVDARGGGPPHRLGALPEAPSFLELLHRAYEPSHSPRRERVSAAWGL